MAGVTSMLLPVTWILKVAVRGREGRREGGSEKGRENDEDGAMQHGRLSDESKHGD